MSAPIKNAIRRVLAHFGYEIRRKRPDPMSRESILMRMHALQPIQMILDVGANEGQSAFEYRGWYPDAHIVSFEPHGPTFARPADRARRDPSWDAENLALGAVQGAIEFNENVVSGTNSILETDPQSDSLFADNPHRTRSVTRVTVERVDNYCCHRGIDRIGLLNIDTQGFDLEVLKGCGTLLTPASVRLVITEVLFLPLYERQARFEEILSLMGERGYKLYNLVGGHFDESRGLYWSNALFLGH